MREPPFFTTTSCGSLVRTGVEGAPKVGAVKRVLVTRETGA